MLTSNVNRKNALLKVVILGDGCVGKSALMNRFVSNNFDNHSFHTVGVEFSNKDVEVNGEFYTLQVDLATEKHEVDESEVMAWCEENGRIPMIETSAKDAVNVDKTFILAVEQWKKLEEYHEKSNDYSGNTFNLQKQLKKENNLKSGCCS